MKVMIVVTHLLGTGHLSRALTLGRSFRDAGHDVRVVSGGMPATHLGSTGVRLVQLPPLRSDGINFSTLLNDTDTKAGPDHFAARTRILDAELTGDPPDVLITELFPFGRRGLKAEFLHMLNTARTLQPKPLVFSSVRDILAPPSKPEKARFAETVAEAFYDGVLVHSDPAIAPLDASWPVTPELANRLIYTGFVAPPAPDPHPGLAGQNEILISAGGGAVGAGLFQAACDAAQQDPGHTWRILVGGTDAEKTAKMLSDSAPANVIAEPARTDFRQMLQHAKASVSMCGYNTALDVLQTAVPAVFVPFDDGDEVEQSLRAKALSAQNGVAVVISGNLSAQTLLDAVRMVCAAPARAVVSKGMNGAARTVELVTARRAAG